jgi:hypothetical protein
VCNYPASYFVASEYPEIQRTESHQHSVAPHLSKTRCGITPHVGEFENRILGKLTALPMSKNFSTKRIRYLFPAISEKLNKVLSIFSKCEQLKTVAGQEPLVGLHNM